MKAEGISCCYCGCMIIRQPGSGEMPKSWLKGSWLTQSSFLFTGSEGGVESVNDPSWLAVCRESDECTHTHTFPLTHIPTSLASFRHLRWTAKNSTAVFFKITSWANTRQSRKIKPVRAHDSFTTNVKMFFIGRLFFFLENHSNSMSVSFSISPIFLLVVFSTVARRSFSDG